MKLFHILAVIFCLGIFLVPKGSFYPQSMQDTCCKAKAEKNDCCKNHSSEDGKDHQTNSSCNDDCCTTCIACYTYIETPFSKNLHFELSYYKTNKNPQFQYSPPHLSDRLKEIWQPPKLG